MDKHDRLEAYRTRWDGYIGQEASDNEAIELELELELELEDCGG